MAIEWVSHVPVHVHTNMRWHRIEGRKAMLGAILPGGARVDLKEFTVPESGYGQVLLRMRASGLCGSDLRANYHEHIGSGVERYQGCIAGHEPCGQVEVVGPGVRNFHPGDRPEI